MTRQTAPQPQGREDRISRGVGIAMSLVWLGFMILPVASVWSSTAPVSTKVVFLGLLALFVVAYVWGMIYALTRPRPFSERLYPACLAAIAIDAIIAAAVTGFEPSGIWLGTYIVALIGITLPLRIAYPLGALTLFAMIGVSWQLHPADTWAIAIIAVGIYISTIGSSFFSRQADREKAAARQEAVVSERERVARDVHDVLGHTLTVISLKSELAAKLLDAAPERARAEVLEINELSRQAIADVRATVSGLSGRQLATEIAVIRELAAELHLELTIVGTPDDADPRHRIIFGWVAREAFTNVVRHAHARRVTITIEPHRLAVSDDGVGFGGVEGNGLRGLRTRVEEAGGTLTITGGTGGGTTEPGDGTTIEVRA